MMKDTAQRPPHKQEEQESVASPLPDKQPWQDPKLAFVEPKLTVHGPLKKVSGERAFLEGLHHRTTSCLEKIDAMALYIRPWRMLDVHQEGSATEAVLDRLLHRQTQYGQGEAHLVSAFCHNPLSLQRTFLGFWPAEAAASKRS